MHRDAAVDRMKTVAAATNDERTSDFMNSMIRQLMTRSKPGTRFSKPHLSEKQLSALERVENRLGIQVPPEQMDLPTREESREASDYYHNVIQHQRNAEMLARRDAEAQGLNEEIDEYLNEIILSEAKFKDVKAKYAQYDDMVDGTRDEIKKKIGDKGVSKYLLYVMRETHQMFDEPETEDEVLDELDDMIPVVDNLIDLIAKYEKNISRIDQKDIYKLNASQLEQLVDNLGKSSTQKKKETKGKVHKESVLIYEDDDVLAVRPLTTEASNYYGMGTRWCISATECENFFDQYTIQGKAFVMLMLKNNQRSPDDVIKSKFGKVALEYNADGAYIRAWDSPDVTMDLKKLIYAVSYNMYDQRVKGIRLDNVERLLNNIIDKGSENIVKQPTPNPKIEIVKKIRKLKDEYKSKLKDGILVLDIVDTDIDYFTTFRVPLHRDFEPAKTGKEEMENTRKLEEYLRGKYFPRMGVGVVDFIDIRTNNEDDGYHVLLDISDTILKDEREYQEHLNKMMILQKNFKKVQKDIEKFLSSLGYFQNKEKIKSAADKIAKIDAQDGTDPVNEYFSELVKTDLEKRIEKMTINEWLDPECPAPWDEDYEDKK